MSAESPVDVAAVPPEPSVLAAPSALARYRADIAALAAHQKSSRGAPPYSLLINRPLGRRFAALAHLVGLTPNQVSLISFGFTAAGLLVFAVMSPSWPQSILATALLVLGYAIDSADGQLARLTTGGSLAGEWLDHTLDSVKLGVFHGAILVSAYRFDADLGVWPQVTALAFGMVAATLFLIFILTDQLRRGAGGTAPERPQAWWFMVLNAPTDYGVQCLWMVMRPSSTVFFGGYGLLALANLGYLGVSGRSRFRQMQQIDRERVRR